MTITVTDQRNTSATRNFRVEIKDASGYGLGYGDTPRMAYADARRDYQDYRRSETRVTLQQMDAQFKAQEA